MNQQQFSVFGSFYRICLLLVFSVLSLHHQLHQATVTAAPVVTIYNIPHNEYLALRDLYYSTDGPNWQYPDNNITSVSNKNPWNFTALSSSYNNPCTQRWQGIQCSSNCVNTPCVITQLQLVGFHMRGVLPTYSLGNFTYLTVLMIAKNSRLGGSIPSSIYQMNQLRALNLGHNVITGTISDKIGQLTQLVQLDFSGNRLNGTLSNSILTLNQLRVVELISNRLSGTIWSDIGDYLPNLQVLTLAFNRFNGTLPKSLSRISQLTVFSANNNQLSGSIWPEYKNLTQLRTLYIGGNQLTGSIAPELLTSWGPTMQSLSLLLNQLTGIIPDTIGNMSALTYLELNSNMFSMTIPDTFLQLKNLTYVLLNQNMFCGELPKGMLHALPNLLVFAIPENELTGELNPYIENNGGGSSETWISLLFEMDLHANQFTGSLPSHNLVGLPNLAFIYLHNNYFTSTLYPSPNSNSVTTSGGVPLTNIRSLLIQNNLFSGSLPSTIGLWIELTTLNASNNMLSSSLPTSIQNCQQLKTLDLSSNYFTGKIVDQTINALSSLQKLFLQNNQFSGKMTYLVDATNGKVSSLYHIDIGNNYFSGTFQDTSIFTAANLSSFAAVSNCITGTIPTEICSLSDTLQVLGLDGLTSAVNCYHYLKKNNVKLTSYELFTGKIERSITGSIPTCIFSMKKLSTLHVSGNQLRGSLSNSLPIGESLTDLVLSHNMFTGSIPATILAKTWVTLDLSFNKFKGTLSQNRDLFLTNLTFDDDYRDTNALNDDAVLIPTTSTINDALSMDDTMDRLPTSLSAIRIYRESFDEQEFDSLRASFEKNQQLSRSLASSSTNVDDDMTPNDDMTNPYYVPSLRFSNQPDNSTAIYLHVNRLSGPIPSKIRDLEDVNVLKGNMFYCRIGEESEDLPPHDDAASNYECGSNSVNIAIYLWISVTLVIVGIVVLLLVLFRRGVIFKEISELKSKSGEVMGGLVSQFKGIIFVTNDEDDYDDDEEDGEERLSTTRRSSLWTAVSKPFRARPSMSSSATEQSQSRRNSRRQSNKNKSRTSLQPVTSPSLSLESSPSIVSTNESLTGTESVSASVTNGPSNSPTANSLKLTLAMRLILIREYFDYAKYWWKEICTTLYLRRGTIQSLHQPASSVQQQTAVSNKGNVGSGGVGGGASQSAREMSYYGALNRLELVVERIQVINNFLQHKYKREKERRRTLGEKRHQELPVKPLQSTLAALEATSIQRDDKTKDSIVTENESNNNENEEDDDDSLSASSRVLHVMINDMEDLMKLMTLASLAFNRFTIALRNVRTFVVQFTMIIFFIFLPLYCILSHFYASYTFKYAWFISLAFLSGIAPAVIALFLFVMLLLWIEKRIFDTFGGENHFRHKLLERERRREEKDKRLRITSAAAAAVSFASSAVAVAIAVGSELTESNNDIEEDHEEVEREALTELEAGTTQLTAEEQRQRQQERMKKVLERKKERIQRLEKKFRAYWYLRAIVVIVTNIATVIVVNGAYVYATTSDLSKSTLFLIKLSISTFKLIWAIEMTARFYHNYMNYPLKELKRLAVEFETVSLELQELENGKGKDKEKATATTAAATTTTTKNYKAYDNFIVQMLIYLSMFNSVIAPILAVAFVSADCFYYVINDPPSVNVEYTFLECTAVYVTPLGTRCVGIDRVTQSTSYIPSYQYSYECSSSLMTSFGDVFVYRYVISSFVMPLITILIKYAQEIWHLKSKPQDVSTRTTSNKIYLGLSEFITEYLPPSGWILSYIILSREILEEKEQVKAEAKASHKEKQESRIEDSSMYEKQSESLNPMMIDVRHSIQPDDENNDEEKREIIPGKNCFNAKKFVTLLVSDIAMILTFGTIFPPIALLICISIIIDTSMNQMSLYRALSISNAIISNLQSYYHSLSQTYHHYGSKKKGGKEKGKDNEKEKEKEKDKESSVSSVMNKITYQDALLVKCINNMAIIIRECNAIDSLLNRSISSVMIIAAMFWSFFLFDIYGDVSPFPNAIWVLLVMALTPLGIWFVRSYVTGKLKRNFAEKLITKLGGGASGGSNRQRRFTSSMTGGNTEVANKEGSTTVDIELKPMN